MGVMSRRIAAAALVACVLVQTIAPAAEAGVNVERTGDENPMKEVAKSVFWGALAGTVLGSAIALATNGSEGDEDAVRWGFAAGAFVGLGMGLWWVNQRPEPTAMLDVRDGALTAHVALPEPGPGGSLRLVAARVRF
jgi:hypothetical protein